LSDLEPPKKGEMGLKNWDFRKKETGSTVWPIRASLLDPVSTVLSRLPLEESTWTGWCVPGQGGGAQTKHLQRNYMHHTKHKDCHGTEDLMNKT
jgi:hypothetical protein